MKKTAKRILSALIALCLAVSVIPAALAVWGGSAGGTGHDPDTAAANAANGADKVQAVRENRPELVGGSGGSSGVTVTPAVDPGIDLTRELEDSYSLAGAEPEAGETVRAIVVFEDKSLLDQGFTAQEIALNGDKVVKAGEAISARQTKLLDMLDDAVAGAEAQIEAAALSGEELQVNYRYSVLLNGVSVDVPYGAIDAIRRVEGVREVYVARRYSLPVDIPGTLEPQTAFSGQITGSTGAWGEGYTGLGMRIAIIDTGLCIEHPSFSAEGFPTTEDSLTQEEIGNVLGTLNAKQAMSRVKASDLYRNAKVPYAFSYVDRDLDVSHSDGQGDHGTHVAGIAAANKLEGVPVVGAAPDAQILVMKVFGDNGGAYQDDIVAALEDAMRLGADAVNMSLGSPAGFSTSGDELEDAVYSKATEHGMILSISAGNSGSFASGNASGTDHNLTGDPDNGVTSSPGSYAGATMVASRENSSIMLSGFKLGEETIAYTDVAIYPFTGLIDNYAYGADELEMSYLMIPGVGRPEDFDEVADAIAGFTADWTPWIAVIERGEIDFTAKQQNAANAGAAACIVYDNADGVLSNMQDAGVLPNIFISRADGEKMRAAADSSGMGTLTIVSDSAVEAPNEDAGKMSVFSSWGVSPDLTLAPDITAPGGHIYSTLDGGKYGDMSGTSMAAPQIAGLSALVLQYLREKHPELSDAALHTVAEALIMSTAQPIEESEGLPYSPRWQGAGEANAYNAVMSPVYITVDGGEEKTPKASLGDSPEGVYTFKFDLNSFGTADHVYRLDSVLLTDQYQVIDGVEYMGETGRALGGSVAYSFDAKYSVNSYDVDMDLDFDLDDVQLLLDAVNGLTAAKAKVPDLKRHDYTDDGAVDTADAQYLYERLKQEGPTSALVLVPAGETVSVTATVTLSAQDREYMDAHYENGIYVDGFVRAIAQDRDAVDIGMPFMGFYGDWSAARVFDGGWWYEDEPVFERYANVIFTDAGDGSFLLGINPYTDTEYDPAHNIVSPNGDGYADMIDEIYVSMMRSAKKLTFSWTDEAGNKLREDTVAEYVRKSYLNESSGVSFPFMLSEVGGAYDFTDESGEPLPNNKKLTLTVSAWLDDGDESVDESFTVPITVDVEAPKILSARQEGGKLILTVSDNQYIAAVVPITSSGAGYKYYTVDAGPGESAEVEIDLAGFDTVFQVAVCDYGFNETYITVTLDGGAAFDPNSWYAYRYYSWIDTGYGYYADTNQYNGWYSFTDAENMVWRSACALNGENDVTAAEYVDGYILGVDVSGNIFAVRPGSWTRIPVGTFATEEGLTPTAVDMTYDYANGKLYFLTAMSMDNITKLLTVDPMTGKTVASVEVTGNKNELLTLAAGNDGTLYSVETDAENASLYTIDPVTGKAEAVGKTGVVTGTLVESYDPETFETVYTVEGAFQSMAVDHATGELYWLTYRTEYDSANYSYIPYADFYKVDTSTGEAELVSGVMYDGEMTGLLKPYQGGKDILPDAHATGITLSDEELYMCAGSQAILEVLPEPYYADLSDVTWTTSDKAVATVDKGCVTAVGGGTATVTATSGGASVTCTVTVVAPKGELTVFDPGVDLNSELAWVRFDVSNPQKGARINGDVPLYTVLSEAYRGGRVYCIDANGNLYSFDPDTLTGSKITMINARLMAMAFNYHDGYMYAVREVEGEGFLDPTVYTLVRLDPGSGYFETVTELDMSTFGGMTVDYEGNFYLSYWDSMEGGYVIEKATLVDDELQVIDSAAIPYGGGDYWFVTCSMVYSGRNDAIFWIDDIGQLIYIDKDTLKSVYVGGVLNYEGTSSMLMGLYEIPETEPKVPEVDAESFTASKTYQVLAGGTTNVGLRLTPMNATSKVSYSIDDSGIASVTEDGIITGISEGTANLTITVEGLEPFTAQVKVMPSGAELKGFAVEDLLGYSLNSWMEFEDLHPEVAEIVNSDLSQGEISVFAGTYYDGKLYTYAHMGEEYDYRYYFVVFDKDYDMTVLNKISQPVRDMAFDYTTGTLYAVAWSGVGGSSLLQIDTESGGTAVVGSCDKALVTLTVDKDGQLYSIGADGVLYKLDKTSGKAEKVGPTGRDSCSGYQSMHYDMNTGNTYWSYMNLDDYSNGLYVVDLESGTATQIAPIGNGLMLSTLYTVPEAGKANVPATVDPSGVAFASGKATVAVGHTAVLDARALPISVSEVDGELTWESDNTGIATVEDGEVTGVSEGTAVITAADSQGNKASCTVTVTAEPRQFYAYDETNTQWISFDDEGEVSVSRADADGESTLRASLYVQELDTIFAYDDEGNFYSIDPDTFDRELLGTDPFEGYENWDGMIYSVHPTDFAWDAESETLYLAANAYSNDPEFGFYCAHTFIYTVDVENGQREEIFSSDQACLANLIVLDGNLYMVDDYDVGMYTLVDPDTDELTDIALVPGYWSEPSSSRSFFIDELTDVIYAVRDFAGGGIYGNGDTPDPVLYIFDKNDASIAELCHIGSGTLNGVFIR